MDELISALQNVISQLTPDPQHVVAADNHSGNAQSPGLVGKWTIAEAHQLGSNGFVQILQQTQHVSFSAAGVTAADQMDDFHEKPSFRKKWS